MILLLYFARSHHTTQTECNSVRHRHRLDNKYRGQYGTEYVLRAQQTAELPQRAIEGRSGHWCKKQHLIIRARVTMSCTASSQLWMTFSKAFHFTAAAAFNFLHTRFNSIRFDYCLNYRSLSQSSLSLTNNDSARVYSIC